ncbi:MAG: hypothetical protein AAFV07_17300 [Bacteroidota bacterium]
MHIKSNHIPALILMLILGLQACVPPNVGPDTDNDGLIGSWRYVETQVNYPDSYELLAEIKAPSVLTFMEDGRYMWEFADSTGNVTSVETGPWKFRDLILRMEHEAYFTDNNYEPIEVVKYKYEVIHLDETHLSFHLFTHGGETVEIEGFMRE